MFKDLVAESGIERHRTQLTYNVETWPFLADVPARPVPQGACADTARAGKRARLIGRYRVGIGLRLANQAARRGAMSQNTIGNLHAWHS
jgi:hypothetical protein